MNIDYLNKKITFITIQKHVFFMFKLIAYIKIYEILTMKQKYKLIAFDIDGTIKTTDNDVLLDTISSIHKANELGAKVSVITGRAYLSAKEVITKIGLSAPIVTFQGAHIADPYTDYVHWKKCLDKSSLDELIQIFQNCDEEILFYTEKEIYTTKISDWNTSYSRRNSSDLIVLNNFNELLDKEIIRITVICPDGAKEFTDSLLSQTKGKLYVTTSLANFCEILHPKAGKKHGLQILASLLEIDRKNVLSFGNSIEDLAMLEWAGHGVIVDNRNANLLSNTLEYCDSVEENGPATYLNKLMDQGLIGI